MEFEVIPIADDSVCKKVLLLDRVKPVFVEFESVSFVIVLISTFISVLVLDLDSSVGIDFG